MRSSRVSCWAVLLLAGAGTSNSQTNVWVARGPEGGTLMPPAFDPGNPNTLYVSTPWGFSDPYGIVFRTTDAATHWDVMDGAHWRVIAADPRNPHILYGDGSYTGLRKSIDGGLSWVLIVTRLPPGCDYARLLIDPDNTSTLYVPCSFYSSSSGAGLFKSSDGGANWAAVGLGLPSAGIDTLLMDPQNPTTLYASSTVWLEFGAGIYKSTDGGLNWIRTTSDQEFSPRHGYIRLLAIDRRNPNTLYALERATATLFRSSDAGKTWDVVANAFTSTRLVIDPQDSGVLYATEDHRVLKSIDGGASWDVALSADAQSYIGWLAAAPAEGGLTALYALSGQTIIKSVDGGATWSNSQSGILATNISALAVHPLKPMSMAAASTGIGISTSNDGANVWTSTAVHWDDVQAIAFDPRGDKTLYINRNNKLLFRSAEGGASPVQLLPLQPAIWESTSLGPIIDASDPATVYFGRLKSRDGGASWEELGIVPRPAVAFG